MLKKSLAVGIIFFLVISSVPYSILSNEISTGTFSGNTLYVGGSGPGNYSRIQGAINDANDGDTIYVFNGSYRENINIDKPLFLTGEDNNSTIISGFGADEQIVNISANNVTINNFLILNSFVPFLKYDRLTYLIYLHNVKNVSICSNNFISDNDDIWSYIELDDVNYCTIKKNNLNGSSSEEHVINLFGIRLKNSDDNIISENIIKFHWESSISLIDSNNNIITNNSILNTTWGIELYYSDKNIIRRNIIGFNEYAGIDLFNSSKNLISENIISQNGVYGITLFEAHKNNITKNNIVSNDVCGIDICSNGFIWNLFFSGESNRTASLWNTISYNNFIDNTKHASFQSSYCTNWKMNYWGQPRTKPYPIYGKIGPFYKIALPWVQFDWHPAKKPYDIPIPEVP